MAHTIKTETKVGGNTADRVGSAFEGVADALEGTEQIAEMDKAVQEVQQHVEASKEQIQSLVNALPVVQQTGDSTTSVMSQKAVSDKLSDLASRMTETSDTLFTPDLSIGDEDGNIIAQFSDGHIKTKNFDSRDVQGADKKFNYTYNAISKISLTKPKFGFDIKKIAEIGWGNQGFCIYNDYALAFSNQGTAARPGSNFAACKIFKITDNDGTPSFTSVTESFLLEGYTPNHANTASLGSKYNEEDDFPLMYMPRCIIGSNQNCIVERISLEGTSQKVQEISIGTYRGEVTASSDIQWTTDGKFLYLFGNTKSSYSANGNKFVFCKLNLPNITSGDISVDLNDAVEFYYFEDYGFHNTNVLQGCKVINDMMILPVGFGSSSGATMSHLYFWDIIHHRLKADINLSALTSGEFEDVEYYKDSLLIFVGGGYIYQLKF